MKFHKESIYYYVALIFAIWFALTAHAWSYLTNLFIALPFGILSLIFWKKGKTIDPNKGRYKTIPVILAIGMLVSIITLIYFLIFE